MTEPEATPDLTEQPGSAIGIKIREEQLVLRPGMLGVAPASALRTQSRGAWRLPTLFAAVNEGVGPEELAGLVFLARRQAKQDVTYDAAVAEIDKLAASAGTVAVIYDRNDAAAMSAVLAGAEVVLDFTWDPTAEHSPEA